MVETRINNSGSATIVLQPNNSSNWQFNLKIVTSLAIIAFFISTYFAFQGLWLIFPFSALFIGALFVSLYLRLRANINTEVITFDKDTVVIQRGCYHAEHTWKYHRLWAKIFVKKPTIRGYPKQIFIRSHGKEMELGSFLNKKDKEILIKDLKDIIYA
ncbi:MAG: DUF2244 domain-containing protein [Proteobacteria bacterium]|nr:DUF2244 domain-containing protein [Pseudomonadota bacterium]